MSGQSGSEPSRLQVLFEAALQDYEKQTGIALNRHPLAEQLQNCDTVESVTVVLCEQTQAFSEFRGSDRITKPLKTVLSVLHKLSSAANFGKSIGLHFPPVTALHTGLGVLLSGVKSVTDSYDTLVDLLESIEHFLKRLNIYTKIPPTIAMAEMVAKILVELLSTLALAATQIKQGKAKKIVKKLLGEKDIEAVLERLDRLTQDEARITSAETLKVVYGLIQNIRVVMDNGKASVDHLRDALEIMQQLASGLNKSKRDNLQQDISSWLSPPDPWKNHHVACKSRHPGSGVWFIQGKTFSDWKVSEAQSPLLWVHGKPGAGKSVICSTIIEEVDAMRKAGLASLAFFYCDFREDQKKDLRGLLSSFLVQLCHQSDSYCDMLFEFYSGHAKGLRHPSDDELVACLKCLLKLPGLAPVYLIVDALDECTNTSAIRSPRAEVLSLIHELIKSQYPNLRICITSRQETDIKAVLDPFNPRYVSLHDQIEQKKDIEDYIKSVINTHPKNRGWKAEDKQLVIDVLTRKADGMFRWVDCQAVYICGCTPSYIRYALDELPETLDETYQRTLREINKADWEFAHRLFQFVVVASRPLRVNELAELLAFDFKAGPIPKYHEGWRLKDPVHAVLSKCSTLLAIVDSGYPFEGKVIQFSHFSVKEFLTSARLAEANDKILSRYQVSMTPAHTLAAQACLGILLHLDKDIITSDMETWPLAKYAAEHWADHAQFEDVSRNVDYGLKQLFDPSKPHLAVCLWIHNPWERTRQVEGALPPLRTSLHYAALWGLHFIIDFLVIEHSQDIHSRGFTDNVTPLHLASKCGHVKAAGMLIKRGADVKAQNKNGETPLHLASQEDRVEVARMLIEHGADVTTKNKDGDTPLHIAVIRGRLNVARMLIESSAGMMAQNEYGETPLHLALIRGKVEVTHMLIECSDDVSAQDKDAETPLHLALIRGQVEVACMLIQHGADLRAENKNGMTPLHLASMQGQVEVVRMLMDCGADLTTQNKDGKTALHLASRWGQLEVARILERGAGVAAQIKTRDSPLHLASLPGEVELEVARMSIEHGLPVHHERFSISVDGPTAPHIICNNDINLDKLTQEEASRWVASTELLNVTHNVNDERVEGVGRKVQDVVHGNIQDVGITSRSASAQTVGPAVPYMIHNNDAGLEKLTQEEARKAPAELLEVTPNIDDKARGVEGKVQNVSTTSRSASAQTVGPTAPYMIHNNDANLDKLTQEEAPKASAELLEVTHNVGDRVKGVEGKVVQNVHSNV